MTAVAAPTSYTAPRIVAAVSGLATAHAYAVVVAAMCVMVGVYWDISWHMSIGRDSFWTPAHLLIQAGGLIAGLSSGYVAIKTTFAGTDADRAAAVSFWGFRAPLGAWVCIWGCIAMLTSAPFDDWWHAAYGLDVKIVSPPHTILALGIYSIVLGALLVTLAKQNRSEGAERRRFSALYLVAGGLLLMNFAIFLTEYSERFNQHGGGFYRVSTLFYPFALVAVARASSRKWAATTTAGIFMGVMLALMWIIHLFPATPKLGPIYHPLTRMAVLAFPVWLIAPGLAIDLARRKLGARLSAPALAIVLGAVFLASFIAVQWPFATFLITSPAARNALFNADNFVYWASPGYVALSHRLPDIDPRLPWDLFIALVTACISSYVGLLWGLWMSKVQR